MLRSAPIVDLELHDLIKRKLKARKITLSWIANEAGCGVSMVSIVSQGYSSNSTGRPLIAFKLDTRPEAIWPSRYQSPKAAE